MNVQDLIKWSLSPPAALYLASVSILDNPEFIPVLRAVLRDGHIIVPALKAKGS